MAYNDLTSDQKNVLSEYVRLLRAWCGEQARTNNHGDALNTDYSQVQAIMDLLANEDVIADGSGLAGAASLTKAEVVSITAHVQGILSGFNTLGHRQLWAKACGPSNLIG
jgi:hypothetical protein